MKKTKAVIFLITAVLCSCAPSRFVKPLAAKQKAVNIAAGGPLVAYNSLTIPVPFITTTYGYGFDSTLTGFAGLNLTSALYGNVQAELGLTKNLLRQHGNLPGLSIAPVANIIFRPGTGTQCYPQLDLNAYWDFNHQHNFFYAGVSNWFDLHDNKALGVKQEHHWFLSPEIGQVFVRRKWDFTIEAKVLAPVLANNHVAVDYKTPFGNHGALGIYFGYTRKF